MNVREAPVLSQHRFEKMSEAVVGSLNPSTTGSKRLGQSCIYISCGSALHLPNTSCAVMRGNAPQKMTFFPDGRVTERGEFGLSYKTLRDNGTIRF